MSTNNLANMSYINDLAKTRVFQRPDGTVSDEILELLEIHVPAMIQEINRLRDESDDYHAAEVIRTTELKRYKRLELLLKTLDMKQEFQFVSFAGPDGPITAEFQPHDYDKLETIGRTISQIKEHLS